MGNHRMEEINSLMEGIEKRAAKNLDIDMYKRLVQKLDSFAPECEQCEALLTDIEYETKQLANKHDQLSREDVKAYEESFALVRSHLEKQHKLIAKGHYQTTYLSIGLALGVVFGLTIFNNIGVGIGLGIALGVGIGAGMDADLKKKGMTF